MSDPAKPAEHSAVFLTLSLDDMANKLAIATASARDELITKAITRHLGDEKWRQNIFGLMGRMARVLDKDLEGETLTLDGQPILYLRRVQTTTEEQGFSHRLKVSFQYQFIDKP